MSVVHQIIVASRHSKHSFHLVVVMNIWPAIASAPLGVNPSAWMCPSGDHKRERSLPHSWFVPEPMQMKPTTMSTLHWSWADLLFQLNLHCLAASIFTRWLANDPHTKYFTSNCTHCAIDWHSCLIFVTCNIQSCIYVPAQCCFESVSALNTLSFPFNFKSKDLDTFAKYQLKI